MTKTNIAVLGLGPPAIGSPSSLSIPTARTRRAFQAREYRNVPYEMQPANRRAAVND
jgi:hypothetical protein